MPNPNNDDDERRPSSMMPRRPPTVQIKRSHPPKLNSIQEVEAGNVTAVDVPDYMNVTFTGDLSVALIREERHTYDRRHTAIATLYETTLPELNRKGSNIAWVQHAKTGELVPVVIMGGEDANEADREENMDSKHTDQAKVPLLRPSPLATTTTYQDIEEGQAMAAQFDEATHSFDDTVVLIRSAFLFAQGLLAGFCLTTICNQSSSAHGDVEFVVSYQPNAMQYRRLFYLLSTISVVGSIDTFMSITLKVSRDIEKRKKKQDSSAVGIGGKRTELPMNSGGIFMSFCKALGSAQEGTNVAVALILMILHAIAFLCTIIMSQVDIIIAVRGGMSPTTPDTVWAPALVNNSADFPDLLRSWKNLDQVRLVASVLAWSLCCFLSWRNLSAVEAKNTEIYHLKDALIEWKDRVNLLEGNEGLEDLPTSALRHLVSLQQMGLDRSQMALKSLTEASRP